MSAINEKAVNGTQLQRTHKKIYRHLMPLLIVAYIISFIDRTNIGMAKATMSVDIGLSATAFGLGAGLFFLTYAVLEIPSNLFLTRIGARRWIARIMITWGILSCGMAFVTGPTSFYVMRLLLGAAEAGLYHQSHTCRRTTWQKAADTSLLLGFATGLLANLGA